MKIFRSLPRMALIYFSALCFLSCSSEDQAQLRVLNLSPDIEAVDVFDDGSLLFGSVKYSEATNYDSLNSGSHQLKVNISNSFTTLSDNRRTLNDGNDYTLFVFGFGDDADVILELDDNSSPDSNRSKLRFVHGSPTIKNIDVYITGPQDSILNAIPTFENIRFENITDYVDSEEGNYRIRITKTKSPIVIADSGTFNSTSGSISTVALVNQVNRGDDLLDIIIIEDKN